MPPLSKLSLTPRSLAFLSCAQSEVLYTEHEEQNRQELRNFYSPLKDCDKYIRFLFITGITKISHVNIFSGLNQLDDISLDKNYSSICGISETELEQYFEPEIKALANEQEMSIEETKTKLSAIARSLSKRIPHNKRLREGISPVYA